MAQSGEGNEAGKGSCSLPIQSDINLNMAQSGNCKEDSKGLKESIVFKDGLQQCTVDVIHPDSIEVSFESFPYYLDMKMKELFITCTYLALKFKNTLPEFPSMPCPRILLIGPKGTDIYQQTLVKALARYYDAKLLVVDWLILPKVVTTEGVKEENVISKLIRLAFKESESSPLIVYLKENARLMTADSDGALECLRSQLKTLPKNVIVILSHCTASYSNTSQQSKISTTTTSSFLNTSQQSKTNTTTTTTSSSLSTSLSPNRTSQQQILYNSFIGRVKIYPPQDETLLSEWNQQLDQDTETLKRRANVACVRASLERIGIECPDDLDELEFKDLTPTSYHNEVYVIPWALTHHVMNSSEADKKTFSIRRESIQYGLNTLHGILNPNDTTITTCSEKSVKDSVVTDNKYEQEILTHVIPPGNVGVSFENIGALESVKDALKELIMIPLQRPELFRRGQLTKPCKGILLFGPPGTGKTVLAKAVATETGANFINITTSTVSSMWYGEGEKFVKAIFTLASKISPAVVFIDEIDSFLGRRGSNNEHEASRKRKNEFMVHWDGLETNDKERVIVLAATNRPYDLDEAVLRRLSRRLMVNLPDAPNREKILEVMLSKEELSSSVKLVDIANMTEGYSGSDLKNLCVTAAHHPIRELLEKEKNEKSLALSENKPTPPLHTISDVRPISMEDFKHAKEQVSASVSSESRNMSELLEWNELYGEGGSRNKNTLSYYI